MDWIPILQLTNYVTLGKLFNSLKLLFATPEIKTEDTYLTGLP